MPRLNSRGEYLAGVGGGGGNLHILIGSNDHGDGVQVGPNIRHAICVATGLSPDQGEGSGWVWKDDRTVAGQLCGVPLTPTLCATFSYNLDTGQVIGPYGNGANDGKGRGGAVGWWLGGYGVYATTGYHNGGAGMADVLANGDLVITRDYQQQQIGLLVIDAAGNVRQEITTAGQIQSVFARGSIVLWNETANHALGAWSTASGGPIAPPAYSGAFNNSGPFAIDSNGRAWIVDSSQGTLLRAWDQPIGYWLSRDGFDFWADVIALPDLSALRVVTSRSQGELAGELRLYDVDTIGGTMTRNGVRESLTLINIDTGQPVNPGTATTPPVSIMRPDGTIVGASSDLTAQIGDALKDHAIDAIGVIVVLAGAALLLTSDDGD